MSKQHLGIGIIAFTTLLLELGLIRAFDVILNPSVGYMVVTIAMFALGLGGIYVYMFKADRFRATTSLPVLTMLYACAALLVLFLLNRLPFNLSFSGSLPVQIAAWLGMYLTIFTPFFLSGIILSIIFSVESAKINGLYFADLAGAGLACLLLMVLIPVFGPGGMLFLIAGLLCLAAFCFSSLSRKALYVVAPIALVLVAYPLVHGQYIEFAEHTDKRGNETMKHLGLREYVKWDPVSKVEVFTQRARGKLFSLDGGQQSSWMTQFDGNYEKYRKERRDNPDKYFYGAKSLAYYLKRDRDADALILGAAVGNEPRAALIFGVREVDAIEMVGAMVRAAKGPYAEFSGNMFNHPQVHYQTGEARTFLRATDKKYDVIQMFSIHNSSSIAQGNGALETVYLQTAEAYEEYFNHLKPDGILAMNRHCYPRMLTTAALAWHRLGRSDFYRHVLVFELYKHDNLPTVLIKMSPWTADEVQEALGYLQRYKKRYYRIAFNPLALGKNLLPVELLEQPFPKQLAAQAEYRLDPVEDDRPFFNMIRKSTKQLDPKTSKFLDKNTAGLLNSQLMPFLSKDVLGIFVVGGMSILFAALFVFVPLLWTNRIGRRWPAMPWFLLYFSCLGAGFIVIELTLIQLCTKVIGHPSYTYAAVLFALLVSAALGSFFSQKLLDGHSGRWPLIFVALVVYGLFFLTEHQELFTWVLQFRLPLRWIAATAFIFPLGFFLGMPFPLGIGALGKIWPGGIAWAWAMNGFFTTVGGFLSMVSAFFLGFRATLLIALGIYCLALVAFAVITRRCGRIGHAGL